MGWEWDWDGTGRDWGWGRGRDGWSVAEWRFQTKETAVAGRRRQCVVMVLVLTTHCLGEALAIEASASANSAPPIESSLVQSTPGECRCRPPAAGCGKHSWPHVQSAIPHCVPTALLRDSPSTTPGSPSTAPATPLHDSRLRLAAGSYRDLSQFLKYPPQTISRDEFAPATRSPRPAARSVRRARCCTCPCPCRSVVEVSLSSVNAAGNVRDGDVRTKCRRSDGARVKKVLNC